MFLEILNKIIYKCHGFQGKDIFFCFVVEVNQVVVWVPMDLSPSYFYVIYTYPFHNLPSSIPWVDYFGTNQRFRYIFSHNFFGKHKCYQFLPVKFLGSGRTQNLKKPKYFLIKSTYPSNLKLPVVRKATLNTCLITALQVYFQFFCIIFSILLMWSFPRYILYLHICIIQKLMHCNLSFLPFIWTKF